MRQQLTWFRMPGSKSCKRLVSACPEMTYVLAAMEAWTGQITAKRRRLRSRPSRRAHRQVCGLTLWVAEVDNAAIVLRSMSGLSESQPAQRDQVALAHLEEINLFDPRDSVDAEPLQGVLEPLVICRAAAAA
jgi:hypothetical protein